MAEMVIFQGQTGLAAIVKAIDAVRQQLMRGQITPQQAASYLGCLNLHLARSVGVGGDFLNDIEECGGLLCPHCRAYLGFISDLSGLCHVCENPIFPAASEVQGASNE